MKEHGIRTLAVPPLHSSRRGFPPVEGAHLALSKYSRLRPSCHTLWKRDLITDPLMNPGIEKVLCENARVIGGRSPNILSFSFSLGFLDAGTIRRFLEEFAHDDCIQRIILLLEKADLDIYLLLLPLFFPRTPNEQLRSAHGLPKDLGGKYGEPVIPERQIRIQDKPFFLSTGLSPQ